MQKRYYNRFLARVAKLNKRFTNRIMMNFAGERFLAVVHHVGRKSGRAYQNPVIATPLEDGYLIPLTYGPGADWSLNVREAGVFQLEHHGKIHDLVEPRLIGPEEALPLLPAWQRPVLRLVGVSAFIRASAAS